MKIVINRCYGGFSLSPMAVARIAELRGKTAYFYARRWLNPGLAPYALTTVGDAATAYGWTAMDIPDAVERGLFDDSGWNEMTMEQRRAHNARYEEHDIEARPRDRTDPALVQAVEELGDAANGDYAKLNVVEIPDGVDYEISEYNGVERVDEVHRSWA
jgi:hypothetical protein